MRHEERKTMAETSLGTALGEPASWVRTSWWLITSTHTNWGSQSGESSVLPRSNDDDVDEIQFFRRIQILSFNRSAVERLYIALGGFYFSPHGVSGLIRVKSLPVARQVAVRFTLDGWKTTGENLAECFESVENGAFEIFWFTIHLEVTKRTQSQELFLVCRYTVGGKEHWDNNNGQYYSVKIV